jgi:hypothetical protein
MCQESAAVAGTCPPIWARLVRQCVGATLFVWFWVGCGMGETEVNLLPSTEFNTLPSCFCERIGALFLKPAMDRYFVIESTLSLQRMQGEQRHHRSNKLPPVTRAHIVEEYVMMVVVIKSGSVSYCESLAKTLAAPVQLTRETSQQCHCQVKRIACCHLHIR